MARLVLEKVESACLHETDRVMSLEEFNSTYSHFDSVNLSASDLQVILFSLSKQNRIVLHQEDDLEIVKFAKGDEIPIVSSTDVGIVRIKETTRKLKQQISQLQSRVDEIMKQVRSDVKLNPERAKRGLMMRKLVDGVLDKRQRAHLMTLEVLMKLQQAETDAQLVSTYQTATSTIRSYVQEKGLTKDKVDETMDELSQVLADQQEIEDAFTSHQPDLADEDLEKELEDLMQQDQLAHLVSPPTNEPIVEKDVEELTRSMQQLEA
jgi:charged multivesicular body protein 7